jgi:axial budding pattern protein 2
VLIPFTMLVGWTSTPLALIFVQLVRPAPVDYFPINSQLPPVARISQPFSFTFSPLTFSSSLPMSYSLANAPNWLSIDTKSRRLFGTPQDQDVPPGEVVGVSVEIIAHDTLGSTASKSTLVVSRNTAPDVGISLANQISNLGPYSAPSSLLLYPSRSFSFAFDAGTFKAAEGSGLNYYAVSRDNAPLPSWLKFEAGNMSFSGTTPPFESLVEPPQSFGIQLVASDVVGFASVSIPFSIVVGNHELTADTSLIMLNASRGSPFQYNDLSKVLKLDQRLLGFNQVNSISADGLPGWLTFDSKSWVFSGTPGPTANSSNVTVAIMDDFSDSINVTLSINIDPGIFRSDFPRINVSPGDQIFFDAKPYLWNPLDVQVNISNPAEVSWIHFDSSIMILSGTVPVASSVSSIQLTFNAMSKTTKETESRNLGIQIASGKFSSWSAAASSPTAIPTTSPYATPGTHDSSSNKTLLWILLPVLLICIALLLLLFCFWRRRRRQQRGDGLEILEVSAPIPGSFVQYDIHSLEGGVLHDMFDLRSLSGKPIVKDLGYAPATSSNPGSSRTSPNRSLESNSAPHAMSLFPAKSKLYSEPTVQETKQTCISSRDASSHSPETTKIGDLSLLSDTSIGSGEIQIHGATSLVVDKIRNEPLQMTARLNVPVIHEPFSIQTTPEIAYIARNSDSSDKESPPSRTMFPGALEHHTQYRLDSAQYAEGSSLRTVSQRVSNVWKRGSTARLFEEYKRRSNLSASTAQTTRTSILTGITGGGSEEEPATANIISRPTIVHIPSRPGDVRQISPRVDESSPLFGGRSVFNPPKNFGLVTKQLSPVSPIEVSQPPPTLGHSTAVPRDSDSSWDMIARNSLGIAYKDLLNSERDSIKSFVTARRSHISIQAPQHDRKWNVRHSKDLMSPDQWPKSNMGAVVKPTSSKAPRLPAITPAAAPVTPKGKGKGKGKYKGEMEAGNPSSASRTPSTCAPSTMKRTQQASRDERLRISRMREQQALDDFMAMMSHTPSPNEWPQPTAPLRPLPETPTRRPLAERPNESTGGGLGTRTNVSRKSNKTTRSEYGETDDGWEDIRPDSTPGGDFFGSSNGSFQVYI